ncbi:hypothetical protein PHYSODRAFT_422173, partial [Phytophthora sojae]
KALTPDLYSWLLHGYPHVHQLIDSASYGVKHAFQVDGTLSSNPVPNHKSASVFHNALIRSIRDGQEKGTYLVVSRKAAPRWKLHFSPFGCVEKADTDPQVEARVIHDLSFPRGASTNAWSNQDSIPLLVYDLINVIVRRIVQLRREDPDTPIKLMKGDVKAAYKNVHVLESVSAFFAGAILEDDVVVIDLSLPFGWTGSAAHYGVFGKAISYLVRRESPNTLNPTDPDSTPFFCFDWVNDHVAINDKTFSEWSTKLVALGLEWDSVTMSVSMPKAKIEKALNRVLAMQASNTTTRTQLSQLLGSLRHVCSCIRPAKPCFQRLAALWKRFPRAQAVHLTREAHLDLAWFAHILRYGRLRGVPLTYFCELPDPDVHLYMDSSDKGLCVLNPALREFIRVEFDATELILIKSGLFNINVREQFSALLAVLCWGQLWSVGNVSNLAHVRMWIDNSTAVAWCNKLASTNIFSQEMNRVFGAVEAEWGVRISAGHLAGSANYLADLGSRAWSNPMLAKWLNLTHTWTQVQVGPPVR